MTLNSSLYASDRMDWETPHDLFNRLNAEFQFVLDPCCTPETAKCSLWYTREHDGLKLPWFGSVFMNPPYGRTIKDWVAEARCEADKGATVVCLLPCRTDTRWWHEHVMKASEIRLLNRRLTFHGGTNKAPFPAAIVVFRPGDQSGRLSAMCA